MIFHPDVASCGDSLTKPTTGGSEAAFPSPTFHSELPILVLCLSEGDGATLDQRRLEKSGLIPEYISHQRSQQEMETQMLHTQHQARTQIGPAQRETVFSPVSGVDFLISLNCPVESLLWVFISKTALPVAIFVSLDAPWTRCQTEGSWSASHFGNTPHCFH